MADKLANYELYLKKLSQLGIDTTKLAEDFGEKLADATFSTTNENGLAYDGALINVILYKLTPYAIKLNELFPKEIQVDKSSLVKVCLLHHIAKAIRLTKNDNEWEIEKRGLLYKYTPNQPSIRTGLHSLVIAQNCGIPFTPEEAEVIEAAVSLASCQKMREQYAHHILVIAYNECMLEHVSVDKVVFFRRSYEIWQISRHQWQPVQMTSKFESN